MQKPSPTHTATPPSILSSFFLQASSSNSSFCAPITCQCQPLWFLRSLHAVLPRPLHLRSIREPPRPDRTVLTRTNRSRCVRTCSPQAPAPYSLNRLITSRANLRWQTRSLNSWCWGRTATLRGKYVVN